MVSRTIIRGATYQAFRGLDERPVHAVHLVIKSACVTEIMTGAVPSPERRRYRPAVDALATLAELEVHRSVCNRYFHDRLSSAFSFLFTAEGRSSVSRRESANFSDFPLASSRDVGFIFRLRDSRINRNGRESEVVFVLAVN